MSGRRLRMINKNRLELVDKSYELANTKND